MEPITLKAFFPIFQTYGGKWFGCILTKLATQLSWNHWSSNAAQNRALHNCTYLNECWDFVAYEYSVSV